MASRSGKIGLIVENREMVNGLMKVTVRMLNSTMSQGQTNELPIMLNAILGSSHMDPLSNDRFTYTFPFALSQGFGFPYVFDLEFDEDSMLTLA